MWEQFRLMAPDLAPSGGAPAAAPPAPAAPPAAAPPAAAAPPTSALAGAPPAAAAAPTGLEFIAAKFHVKTADGKLDEAASIRKQAEGYVELEKVRPQGEAPPATAAEYKLTAPKDLEPQAFEEFMKDPATVTALEGMHKIGLNNKQVDLVMNMYLASAAAMAQGGQVLSTEDCIGELRKEWKTDADLTKNLGAARHAATVLGARVGMDFDALEKAGLTNNPAFIRMAAAIAPELGEDRAPAGAALAATDLDSLVKSKAYMDPNDPNHAAVKAKVAQHFASLPGGANKPRGPVTISP